MVVFPNCKINIGLCITGKRADGFHNLETVFYPVQIKDALEIIESETFSFHSTGISSGDPADNICIKAFDILKERFNIPNVRMHLHKVIPSGAGLGGGSADAAFTLRLLNQKFQLNLNDRELMTLAADLGSDCPFFILNKPAYAAGRGELLTPIELDLSGFKILIVNPGIHISTKEAFANVIPAKPSFDLQTLPSLPIEDWKQNVNNSFLNYASMKYPVIAELIAMMYQNDALFCSMSGSGSTVYGIFKEKKKLDINPQFFSKWV